MIIAHALSLFTIPVTVAAGALSFADIYGNDTFLNKQIVVTGYVAALNESGGSGPIDTVHYPLVFIYPSLSDHKAQTKKMLFFDTSTAYCQENDCRQFFNKMVTITGTLVYLGAPINFHGITGIKHVEINQESN